MKIAFVTTYFYPVLGGAESNCFYLAKELAKRHEVHVFTSGNGLLKEEEVFENMHIHRSKTLFRIGYYGAFYPSLLFKLVKEEFDIVHVHSFGFLCYLCYLCFLCEAQGPACLHHPKRPSYGSLTVRQNSIINVQL